MTSTESVEYVIINNIPKTYHSSHLRNFFSNFIESGGFICFHYRHRPEVQKPSSNKDAQDQCRRVTNCCIVKVAPERVDEFVEQYNGEHWLDCKGETLMTCCFIKKIKFSRDLDSPYSSGSVLCKQGTVVSNLPLDKEDISKEDVDSLIEMHPPTVMPNGNVGTKTSHFLNEIKACRLPTSLIAKLGLQFPRNRSKRIYGSVALDYENRTRGKAIIYSKERAEETRTNKKPWCSRLVVDNKREESENEESEEEEEWDRHEALHDDVTGQERNKERLFEEKIELKWEKGGSGLVFYTDAQYWDAKEGDFDAKTSDDWDVDTSIYTNRSGLESDKDMRDLIRLRLEKRLRKGTETESDRRYDFAAFEKYNKGFGRKIMESQGWKQGQGIGKSAGISEPIPNEGQLPDDKKGFGYRGEKLERHPKRQKRRRSDFDEPEQFKISTVFDNPEVSDPPQSVFVSSSFSRLKYRKEFLKEHNCDV